jgi:hypothetical protein
MGDYVRREINKKGRRGQWVGVEEIVAGESRTSNQLSSAAIVRAALYLSQSTQAAKSVKGRAICAQSLATASLARDRSIWPSAERQALSIPHGEDRLHRPGAQEHALRTTRRRPLPTFSMRAAAFCERRERQV